MAKHVPTAPAGPSTRKKLKEDTSNEANHDMLLDDVQLAAGVQASIDHNGGRSQSIIYK